MMFREVFRICSLYLVVEAKLISIRRLWKLRESVNDPKSRGKVLFDITLY